MDPAQITENRNRRDVFAVKRKNGAAERAHRRAFVVVAGRGLLVGGVSVQGIVLKVVGGGNFCKKGGNHLDDIAYGHLTNLVFHRLERRIVQYPGPVASIHQVGSSEALDMGEIAHEDGVALWRRGGIFGTNAGHGRPVRIGIGGGLLLCTCRRRCGAASRC